MPIQVTCTKCHTRFNVAEKFAGRTGPCPKCKNPIKIPAADEQVVIHAPDHGPTDSEGRAVLKPIERTEAKVSPVMIAVIVGIIVIIIVAAIVLRFSSTEGGPPTLILALGALAVAPPVVLAGYSFLRDDELEPYRGTSLAIRVAICAVVYAALWGLYAYLVPFIVGEPQLVHMVFVVPAVVGIGALASFSSLDFDFGTAAIHYGFYLLVTVLLRLTIGLSAF